MSPANTFGILNTNKLKEMSYIYRYIESNDRIIMNFYNGKDGVTIYFKRHRCICLEGFKKAKNSEPERPAFGPIFQFGTSPIRSMSGNYFTVTTLPESMSVMIPL
jgi:hypothetical protein